MYIALLDVRKAFDTVWHHALLVEKGIQGAYWKFIDLCYSSSTSCVLWNGAISSPFQIQQGVRQGAILSPLLYCIFANELLDIPTTASIGIQVKDIYCGALMYTDDLALLASTPEALQELLDLSANYAAKWHYSYNPDKSVIMVLGETPQSRLKNRLDTSVGTQLRK